jgi:hypothetical protein
MLQVIKSTSPVLKALFTTLAILFIFFVSLAVVSYMLATNKLPYTNTILKIAASNYIFSLPFIPKTPEYVLGRVTTKNSVTLELTISGKDVATQKFSAEFRYIDNILYAKVLQIPAAFISLHPAFNDWIAIDTSKLKSRSTLDEHYVQNVLEGIFQTDIIPATTLTQNRLTFSPNAQQLNQLIAKISAIDPNIKQTLNLSKTVQNPSLELWVDQNFTLYKLSLTATLNLAKQVNFILIATSPQGLSVGKPDNVQSLDTFLHSLGSYPIQLSQIAFP